MNVVSRSLIAFVVVLLAMPVFAQTAAPDDAQIAAIVVAANQVDVDAGKFAESRAENAQVKDFAQRMVTDHSAVNQQATALVTKLGIKPEESELSKSLKEQGKETLDKLRGLEGQEFDRAYIDHEVSYHQAVLDAIDQTLLPNTQNAELKALITKARPVIETHLQHAQQLQASLE